MRSWMPPQVVRIVLLTAAIIVSYMVARFFLYPKSFGKYGWYRANALSEIASLPPSYAGRKKCDECHAEIAATMAVGKHKPLACEACHGASLAHVDDPGTSPPRAGDFQFCLRCHAENPSRPAKFPQIVPADHYSDMSCGACHLPHNPTEGPPPTGGPKS